MRNFKAGALDLMLENAVAVALGLERPHPEIVRRPRRVRPEHHHAQTIAAPRPHRRRVAA